MSRVEEIVARVLGVRSDASRINYPEDLIILATAYGNLIDPTPIDEAWAAKVRSEQVSLTHCPTLESWGFISHGPTIVANVTTRGQVRCLLMAAGIDKKRKSNEQ